MIVALENRPRLKRNTRLGKYHLVEYIASGGFSDVWKARDTIEQVWVALKIPHAVTTGSDSEEELLEEIRLSARLDHPNVVRVRNADRIDGLYVIASDLAQESLEQRMTRRMSVPRTLSFIRQMLLGLSHAHSNRVIHRDLKPSNIMLFAGDQLRLADFGLARVADRTMISATGSGTLLYFAPEQAHGYPCFASDIFSLGLVCHELLTGHLPRWPFRWPFPGYETLERKVPGEFIRFLRRAVRPDHRARFRDAREMLAAFERLEPACERFLSPKPRTRPKKQRPLGAWKTTRSREFQRAFGKLLFLRFDCPDCRGSVSEHMSSCPWCGAGGLCMGGDSEFPCYCGKCERGLRDEWRFCPWCWSPGFDGASGEVRPDPRYRGSCRSCKKPLIEGMRYCPWCHKKATRPVSIPELPDRCGRCRGSVARDFWEHCPWCGSGLGARSSRRR